MVAGCKGGLQMVDVDGRSYDGLLLPGLVVAHETMFSRLTFRAQTISTWELFGP